jgi:hypothetical protein
VGVVAASDVRERERGGTEESVGIKGGDWPFGRDKVGGKDK